LKLAIWERYCSHVGEPWSQGATYAMRFILDASTRQGYDRAAAKSGQGRDPGPSGQGRQMRGNIGDPAVRPFFSCATIGSYGSFVVSQLEGFASLRAYALRSLESYRTALAWRLSDAPMRTYSNGRAGAQIPGAQWARWSLEARTEAWRAYCRATGQGFSADDDRGLAWLLSADARREEAQAYDRKLASGWQPPPPPKSAATKAWEARAKALEGGVGPFDLTRFAYSDLKQSDVRYLDLRGSVAQRRKQLAAFLGKLPLQPLHRKRLLPPVRVPTIKHPLGATATKVSLFEWQDKAARTYVPGAKSTIGLSAKAYAWPPTANGREPKRQSVRTISLAIAAFEMGNGTATILDRDVVFQARQVLYAESAVRRIDGISCG